MKWSKTSGGPKMLTLPETNSSPVKMDGWNTIAPENGWLEYYFPIGMTYFQVLC